MKIKDKESKKIALELEKMKERSIQICRILDKDDIRVDLINDIGKKRYIKSESPEVEIMSKKLPNLIYYNGPVSLSSKQFMDHNKYVPKFKNKEINNNLHTKEFNKIFDDPKVSPEEGNNTNYLINKLECPLSPSFLSKTTMLFEPKIKIKKDSNLKVFDPIIYEKKQQMTNRLPHNFKMLKKDYVYPNGQLILDKLNEERYFKKDDAMRFSPFIEKNYFCTQQRWHPKKITDYNMKKTLMLFREKAKNFYNINKSKPTYMEIIPNINDKKENI